MHGRGRETSRINEKLLSPPKAETIFNQRSDFITANFFFAAFNDHSRTKGAKGDVNEKTEFQADFYARLRISCSINFVYLSSGIIIKCSHYADVRHRRR